MVQVINGASGPYTGQAGGYGKNAAHNVAEFLTPGKAPKKQPPFIGGPVGGPLSDPEQLKKILDTLQGGGNSNPADIFGDIGGKMKDTLSGGSDVPSIRYTEQERLNQPSMVQDVIGFAEGLLNFENSRPKPPDLNAKKKETVDQMKQFGKWFDLLEPLLGNVFGDLGKDLKPIFQDPEKAIDESLGKFGGNMPNMMPTGPKLDGLSTEILDRDKSGAVDVAEKAAETLFLDDPIGLLKKAVAEKTGLGSLDLDDAMDLDMDKALAYSTLEKELQSQNSVFDGEVTPEERKAGIKATENQTAAELVGSILDNLIQNHNLKNR